MALRAVPLILLLLGLPLLGVALTGQPVARYLEFPPLTRYVEHAPFSWLAFIAIGLFIVGLTAPLLVRIASVDRKSAWSGPVHRPLPWWGWVGAGFLAFAWVLAWTRFDWFRPLQPFTFTPLWIGYIIVVNGLTFRRTGSCLMLDETGYFLRLFPLSAVFWWFFEYLNRFVQNWYYVGGREYTTWEYLLYATLPFSTVLPAVLSTFQWLASFHRLNAAFNRWRPIALTNPKPAAVIGLVVGSLGLLGIGIWPDVLFPFVWSAPVILMTSCQALLGEPTLFSGVQEGDWRPIGLAALAALICGFFWELWNYKSLAHWEYAVPYVHRFRLFEMPLLGYAGYLPFGLECLAAADFFVRKPPAVHWPLKGQAVHE